ncbi:MAG: TonB-dependent receptor [Acidobacteria bacterium]|nr:MAG: TonB-dependent receptor [Acidobacteriota bacterium]
MLKVNPLSSLGRVLLRARKIKPILSGGVVAALIFLIAAPAHAQRGGQDSLERMTLLELLDMKITSVSKKEERSFRTPAAVFVVTNEDIRRSGARNLPDALRLVPGVQVAQIDANKWAVSIRGFNHRFANKLLVLIDGRSVYTPIFSGVYWGLQDLLLEDIERIEVIRGPGATLWGSNAVNGVINIITKHSKDTQGGYAELGAGTIEQGFGSARHGARLGDNAAYRVYTKLSNRGDFDAMVPGATPDDHWWNTRAGFRLDWGASKKDNVMAQGDFTGGVYGGNTVTPSFQAPYSRILTTRNDFMSGNGLVRWNRRFSDKSSTNLQFYFDRTSFEEPVGQLVWSSFDVEFQHQWTPTPRHGVSWGLGSRSTFADLTPFFETLTISPEASYRVFSGWVQDQITISEERLALTVGSKFEHNEYTGAEIQPGIRLAWTPDDKNTVWGAVSRAVHPPSMAENDPQLFIGQQIIVDPTNPMMPPVFAGVAGNGNLKAEALLAFEAGYRVNPSRYVSFDVAGFANRYRDLRSVVPGQPYMTFTPFPHLRAPVLLENDLNGETYGVEITAHADPSPRARLTFTYSYLTVRATTTGIDMESNRQPDHQFGARASFDLPKSLRFDSSLYYVDELPIYSLDNYARFDCRLAWSPAERVELSITGQNLGQGQHGEFGTIFWELPTAVPRSVYGALTFRFD